MQWRAPSNVLGSVLLTGGDVVKRILVATDRSESANRAVQWAASMAERYEAELLLLQVLVPQSRAGTEAGAAEATRAGFAADDLTQFAARVAGPRGRARVVVDEDPARAIVEAAEDAEVDVVVVGNVGMSGRKEFLLGNVPNRVSHNARCTVIIVNTALLDGDGRARVIPSRIESRAEAEEGQVEGHLIGRATEIAAIMAKTGLRELFGRSRTGDEDSTRVRARRLRTALEELGPTFAKLGPILSTRPDLLPPEFIEELATLERAVVKVQRPTAREDIMRDLGLLRLFAEKTADRPGFRQVVDMGAIFEHLSASLQRELDFRQEASNIERMAQVLQSYPRLDVPKMYEEFSSQRLLVMEEIQGFPIRQAPEGQARKEAAQQLLESYYRQILTDGFFHADPHPGNLLWWNDKIYFLDFGMVGELGPEIRELLVLMLMAFWQEDASFLSDVVLMIAGSDQRPDIDLALWQQELGSLMAKYRHVSLKEIELGPILQEITEIAIRHDVALPASLALTGKALAQMQLATATLDPTLDPFAVAGSFLTKGLMERVKDRLDPKTLFYEGQKLRLRAVRLIEAIERLAGARPGPKLAVNFRGTERLEDTIRRAGRRLALALTAGGALVATAITASSTHVSGWVPTTIGILGGLFTVGLVADLVRRRR